MTVLQTDQRYLDFAKEFYAVEQENLEPTSRRKMTVIDAFAGIGSATLCLKRLGLGMDTVIFVEHDPVARFVYEQHHNESDDGIAYHRIETFEEVESQIEQLLQQYGRKF
jgi:16S rRNA G966 N2-methylase RsmD